jgi:hypothetical protein
MWVIRHLTQSNIRENVSTDVDVIITDTLPSYTKAVGDSAHEIVNHVTKKYVRYESGACVTTNAVESAFSLLKEPGTRSARSISPTWTK